MSAPHSKGRNSQGEAIVLSTISSTPASRAIAAIGSMSTSMPPGLARTSMKIALVRALIAARKASGSAGSTKLTFQPKRRKECMNWVIEPP